MDWNNGYIMGLLTGWLSLTMIVVIAALIWKGKGNGKQ